MNKPLLEVENLVRHYERPKKRLFAKRSFVEALNGVSFSVDQGESFGIVGESGSGKSTLARALLALEEPTSGSVRFKGENLFALSAERKLDIRRHVQMVFQDPFGSLDPKHKVRSLVSEPLDLVKDISATEREAKAIEALTDVGLDASDLDKYPHEFSGGQRQRIAIARALITRPELIVADEPVSALDVSVQAQVLNLMMDLQVRFNLTYIIISHDLSVVRHVTDRLAVMQAGLIVEQGRTRKIFDAPSHAYTRELLDSALDIETDEAHPAAKAARDAKLEPEPETTEVENDAAEPESEKPETEISKPEPLAGTVEAPLAKPVAFPVDAPKAPQAIDTVSALRAADTAIANAIALARGQGAKGPARIVAPVAPGMAESADDAAIDTDAVPADVEAPVELAAAETVDEIAIETEATPVAQVRSDAIDEPVIEPEITPTEPAHPVASPPTMGLVLPMPPGNESDHAATPEPKAAVFEHPSMIQGLNLIDGKWQDASDDRLLKVINPSDGKAIGYIARGTAGDIDKAVRAARHALDGPWGRMPAFERGRVLTALARLVSEKVDHLAHLEARDVGKPLRQARADALALARYFEFYGGAADKIHGQTIPYQDGYTVLTLREPHGVTGHIVPCNYPMQIIGRSVGAALAMGNACVLKPGEDASLTALEIGQLALDAGLPPGVLNIVTGLGEEAGAALSAHPGIDHMSFTGSVATGKRVQQAAATHSCPVTLELGGKSPQIVFADADLDQALPFLVNAAIQNAGQTCSAGSRVLIQDWIYDELTHRLAERFEKLAVGPADRDLDCGPVINPIQKQRIEAYLERARADHTDRVAILAEGEIASGTPEGGYYVKPTLLGNVPVDHALAQEEIFGPVLAAIRFSSEEDAVRLANDSAYGLVAGVWTRDGARQMRLARAIKTGQVFINNYGAGGGVELPFGGVKSSGHGREKGFEALYGFSTLKTIAIHHG